jgi:DNA-binding NarL/FixJ family response regulator
VNREGGLVSGFAVPNYRFVNLLIPVRQEAAARAILRSLKHDYVVKTDSRRELLTAVDAVLRGEQFVSRRFSGHVFVGA